MAVAFVPAVTVYVGALGGTDDGIHHKGSVSPTVAPPSVVGVSLTSVVILLQACRWPSLSTLFPVATPVAAVAFL